VESIVDEQLASMDMEEIEELFDIAAENGNVFGDIGPGEIIRSILQGKPIFSFQDIINAITDHFLHEIHGASCWVSACSDLHHIGLLKNLADSFSEDTVSSLALSYAAAA
jgi:hypothetical protein